MRSFIQGVFGIVCFLVVAGLVLGFFFQIVSEILKWLGSVRDSLFGSSDAQVKEPALPEPTPRSALRPVPTLVPPPAPKVVPKAVPKPTRITSSPSRLRLDDLLPPVIKEVPSLTAEQLELSNWINLREAGIGLLVSMLWHCKVDEVGKRQQVRAWVDSLYSAYAYKPGSDGIRKRLNKSFLEQLRRPPDPVEVVPLIVQSSNYILQKELAGLALYVSEEEPLDSEVRRIFTYLQNQFFVYLEGKPLCEVEPLPPPRLPIPAKADSLVRVPGVSPDRIDPIAELELKIVRTHLLGVLSASAACLFRVFALKPMVITTAGNISGSNPYPLPSDAPIRAPIQVKAERIFELKIGPLIEDNIVKGVELFTAGSIDVSGYGVKEFTYWIWDVTRGDETLFRKAMPDIDDVVEPAIGSLVWPDVGYDPSGWNRVAIIYFNQSYPPFGGNRLLVAAGRVASVGSPGSDSAPISVRSEPLDVKIGSPGFLKLEEIRARQVEEEFEPLKRVFALAIGLSMMMATNTTHAQDKVFKRLVADLKDRCVFKANAAHAKDTFERMLVSSKKRRLSYWVNQVDGMTLSADYRLKSLLVDALGRLIDGRKVRSTEAIALYNHCLEAFEFGHLPRKA